MPASISRTKSVLSIIVCIAFIHICVLIQKVAVNLVSQEFLNKEKNALRLTKSE